MALSGGRAVSGLEAGRPVRLPGEEGLVHRAVAYHGRMTSRRLLKSVAQGIAHVFASRNNDADGWWVPGLLLEELPPADPDLRMDLFDGTTVPTLTSSVLGSIGAGFARYLSWSVERHGIPKGVVASAQLELRFDRTAVVQSSVHPGEDHRFSCIVKVRDDRGREYLGVSTGQCSTRQALGLRRSTRRGTPAIFHRLT